MSTNRPHVTFCAVMRRPVLGYYAAFWHLEIKKAQRSQKQGGKDLPKLSRGDGERSALAERLRQLELPRALWQALTLTIRILISSEH